MVTNQNHDQGSDVNGQHYRPVPSDVSLPRLSERRRRLRFRLPYNPKSKNSKEINYFEVVFLLNKQQKHASSFKKLVSWKMPGY